MPHERLSSPTPSLPAAIREMTGQEQNDLGKTENGQKQVQVPSRDATLLFARAVCAAIDEPLRRGGYLVALYGSVLLRGAGGDVDLLLVPWRDHASPEDAIAIIRGLTDGVEVGKRYHGGMGSLATTIVACGIILDVQIREAHRSLPSSVVLAVDRSRSSPNAAALTPIGTPPEDTTP